MPEHGLKELLEAGVHFGHQTRRWNPNMRRYIFGELDGIHIIDLLQTEALLENARRFAGELASGGGTVLFVGTKKQARDPVKEWADRCKMPYVNQRWLGGLLTNFNTISARIARLHELTELAGGGQTRPAADQGADGDAGRTGEARVQPRRRPRHGPAARRGLRHRPENRGDRGPRGGPPADPDHRPGRHQLRPDAGRLRGPRQRRRDPLLPAGDRHDRRRDRDRRRRLARAGGEAASPRKWSGATRRRKSARNARRKRRSGWKPRRPRKKPPRPRLRPRRPRVLSPGAARRPRKLRATPQPSTPPAAAGAQSPGAPSCSGGRPGRGASAVPAARPQQLRPAAAEPLRCERGRGPE